MEEEDKIEEDRTGKLKDVFKDDVKKFVHNIKSRCQIATSKK